MNRPTFWLLIAGLIRWCLFGDYPVLAEERPRTAASATRPPAVPPTPAGPQPPSSSAIPAVAIVANESTRDDMVTLTIRFDSADGPPPQVELRIDERVIPTPRLVLTRDLGESALYEMTISLPHKTDCVISLVAHSSAGASAPARLQVHRTNLGVLAEAGPKLYALAVGVGQYVDPNTSKLAFPSKDANDLIAALQNQRRTVYRDVIAWSRVEQQATHRQLLEDLAWLQTNVRPIDTAIIFLAGHGINDYDRDTYYYLPYDAHPKDLSSMLSGTELHAALTNIAGQVLLLLDTCHSGAVLGSTNLTPLISRLTSTKKISVFAASKGAQTSQEHPEWQNGAFTKALVEGLRGKADDEEVHQVYLKALENWVCLRVDELTKGSQTPTVKNIGEETNYIVAATPRKDALLSPRQIQRRKLLGGLLGGSAAAALLIGVLAARPWEFTGRPTTDLVFH